MASAPSSVEFSKQRKFPGRFTFRIQLKKLLGQSNFAGALLSLKSPDRLRPVRIFDFWLRH